jgi:hypothetical protein
MINCVHFRAQWSEREQLNPTDTMRMRRHLAACERCQAFDQQMRTAGHSPKGLGSTEEKTS